MKQYPYPWTKVLVDGKRVTQLSPVHSLPRAERLEKIRKAGAVLPDPPRYNGWHGTALDPNWVKKP